MAFPEGSVVESETRRAGRPRRKETDEAILHAAEALLRDRGHPGVTMEAVASTAGIAKTTIYRRWPNRGSLLMELYLRGAPDDASLPTDGPALVALTREIGGLVEHLANPLRAEALRGVLSEAQGDASLAQAFSERIVVPRREKIRAILARAWSSQAAPDPDILADALLGAIWYRVLIGREPTDLPFAGRLVRAMLQRAA